MLSVLSGAVFAGEFIANYQFVEGEGYIGALQLENISYIQMHEMHVI